MRRVMWLLLVGLAAGCGDSGPAPKGKELDDAQGRQQKQAEDDEKTEFGKNSKGKKK